MDDHMVLSAICFALAVLLFALFVFCGSRQELKHPPLVRLDDHSTWRRPSGWLTKHWAHIAFPLAIGAGVGVFLVMS